MQEINKELHDSYEIGFDCDVRVTVRELRQIASLQKAIDENFEEAFQLVFEGYNRPGTDFASDAAWATWQHAQLTKAFSLLQKIRKQVKP